jgi:hypothetical protein
MCSTALKVKATSANASVSKSDGHFEGLDAIKWTNGV